MENKAKYGAFCPNKEYEMPAKIWEHHIWIAATAPAQLKQELNDVLSASGFNVLGFQEHYFEPQGYTAVWMLSESHLAIHTFPEHGRTYLQISSCMLPHFINFLKNIEKKTHWNVYTDK